MESETIRRKSCEELEEERFRFDMSMAVRICISGRSAHPKCQNAAWGRNCWSAASSPENFMLTKKTAELLWSFFGAGIGPLRGLGCLPSHLVRCAFKTGTGPSAPIGLGVRADLRKLLGMVQKS